MEYLHRVSREYLTLSSGEVVLFPQQGFIAPYMYKKGIDSLGSNIFSNEYYSILESLAMLVGGNINLIKNRVTIGKDNPLGGIKWASLEVPEMTQFPTIDIFPDGISSGQVFSRDLFTQLPDIAFINPKYLPNFKEDEDHILSSLGIGGKVLTAGRSIIVSEDLWEDKEARGHLNALRKRGYKVGNIPLVKVDSQPEEKQNFVEDHIDGHANLITGDKGKLYFMYSRSYARQGGKTLKDLRNAADFTGAQLIEVNDAELIPLALNFIQLWDNTVLIGDPLPSESNELRRILEEILGKDKVVVTDIPIIEMSINTAGGIRCLTNIASNKLVTRLLKK